MKNDVKAKGLDECPFETAVDVIGGKWKPQILYYLLDGTKRFSELKRLLPGVTQQMLTQQLRQLEGDGIILRRVYAVVPPKVEYSLTDEGHKLKPVIHLMENWGRQYLKKKRID